MGGSATKEFETKRLHKDEYFKVVDFLYDLVKTHNQDNNINYTIIEAYREKETFGDLDFLSTGNKEWFTEILKKAENQGLLKIKKEINNPDLKIFAIQFKLENKWTDLFQLDYIKTNKEDFNFSKNYYAYNDLGNLIGRIAAGLTLKFGHDGLFTRSYFDNNGNLLSFKELHQQKDENYQNNVVNKIFQKHYLEISKDFDKCIEFLGFDSNKFKQGFNSLEDIFDYVYESKYFDMSYFDFENRTGKSRKRDVKRPNYNKALEYFKFRYENDKNNKNVKLPDLNKSFSIEMKKVESEIKNIKNEIIFNQKYMPNQKMLMEIIKENSNIDFYYVNQKSKKIFNATLSNKENLIEINLVELNKEKYIEISNMKNIYEKLQNNMKKEHLMKMDLENSINKKDFDEQLKREIKKIMIELNFIPNIKSKSLFKMK